MQIKILSYVFDLIQRPGFVNDRYDDNSRGRLGEINYQHMKIKVDSEDRSKDETVLHELVHAVSAYWYLDLEEKQVQRLSEGLYHILRENKVDFSKDNIFED